MHLNTLADFKSEYNSDKSTNKITDDLKAVHGATGGLLERHVSRSGRATADTITSTQADSPDCSGLVIFSSSILKRAKLSGWSTVSAQYTLHCARALSVFVRPLWAAC